MGRHHTIFTVWKLFEENILLFSIISLGYYFCLRQKRIIFKHTVSRHKGAYFFRLGFTDAQHKLQGFMILQEDMDTCQLLLLQFCNAGKWPKALFGWWTFSSPFSMILPRLLTTWKTETRLHLDLKLKHCKNVSFLATWFLIPDKECRNKRWLLSPN